jgi:hypothetical protein
VDLAFAYLWNPLIRKMIYQNICHPLRLFKIPQITTLGDLRCSKDSCFFFWILALPHCMWKLPAKSCALTHPLSLLANRERSWTFDLNKSQVRGRCNYIRDIRRSHCPPFCAHVFAQLEWIRACTLLIKRNCLVKIFSVSPVSVFCTRRSLIPTIWEPGPGYYIPSRKRDSGPSLGRCVLLPSCSGPKVWPMMTTFWIYEWTWTPEFLDNACKRALKTGTAATT